MTLLWLWTLRAARGRWWVLACCVACAVAGPAAVAALVEGFSSQGKAEAEERLGAAVVVSSRVGFTKQQAQYIASATKATSWAESREWTTLAVTAPDRVVPATASRVMVQVMAVSPQFPLCGQWQGDLRGWSPGTSQGTVLVEPDFLRRADGARIGDTVRLGNAWLRIAGTVQSGPRIGQGLGGSPMPLGPTIVMSLTDAESTGLIGFGSRSQSLVFLHGPRAQSVANSLKRDLSIESKDMPDVNPLVRVENAAQILAGQSRLGERVGTALACLAALGLGIGGVGAALLGRMAGRHLDSHVRLLRTLGATPWAVAGSVLGTIGAVGGAAALVGMGIGQGLAVIISLIIGQSAEWLPLSMAVGLLWMGIIVPTAAAYGPIRAATVGPPAVVKPGPGWWALTFGLSTVIALVGPGMGAAATVTLLGLVVLFGLVTGPVWLALRGLGFVGSRLPLGGGVAVLVAAFGWGLRGAGRPGGPGLLAGVGLTLVAAAWAGMVGMRATVLSEITPVGTPPGIFLIDIQRDQRLVVQDWSGLHNVPVDVRPVVPARLTGLRGPDQIDKELSPGLLKREMRLSYRDTSEDGDRGVAGRWIEARGEANLDQRWALRHGVDIGDQLAFSLPNGATLAVTVVGLRAVRWTSFRPNFFMYLHPSDLIDADQTWIAVLPGSVNPVLVDELRQALPMSTPIDVAQAVATAWGVLDNLNKALFILAFTGAVAACCVLSGVALAARPAQRLEEATARALGADPRLVPWAQLVSTMCLGLIAGCLGAVGGGLLVQSVAELAEWTAIWPASFFLIPFATAGAAMLTSLLVRRLTG